MIEVVDRLAALLAKHGTQVVDEYTSWFFVSAVVWILFGLAAVCTGIKLKFRDHLEEDQYKAMLCIKVLLVIVGGLIAISHVSDLVAPEAAAIHQLLRDLRV